ncbi:hypothetical protein [Nocardia sp. CA-119907]|uniref:hypothetical protein n=1 Tax=Nocardia sp. CA-119907 TaxID=3239973 RepID=UPI003D95AD78
MQAILREGRENQRGDRTRVIEPSRGQQPQQQPPAPQRTPEQERDNARAFAKVAGLSPEIMGILGLNTTNPTKMLDAYQPRTHADAERERSIHQQRERERAERRTTAPVRWGAVRGRQRRGTKMQSAGIDGLR